MRKAEVGKISHALHALHHALCTLSSAFDPIPSVFSNSITRTPLPAPRTSQRVTRIPISIFSNAASADRRRRRPDPFSVAEHR